MYVDKPPHLLAQGLALALAVLAATAALTQAASALGSLPGGLAVLMAPLIFAAVALALVAIALVAEGVVRLLGPRPLPRPPTPPSLGPFRTGAPRIARRAPTVRWYHRAARLGGGSTVAIADLAAYEASLESSWLDALPAGLEVAVVVAYLFVLYTAALVAIAGLAGRADEDEASISSRGT